MKKQNIKDIYPLTPMQQGMLFHTLFTPGDEVYTEQFSCKISGNLNVKAFAEAWNKTLNRHDALCASFRWENIKEPVQIIHKDLEVPYRVIDWSEKHKDEVAKEFEKIKTDERKKGIDLTKPPLMNFTLFKLNDSEYLFLWNYHHILFDGWSTPIIFKDLLETYESMDEGKPLRILPVRPYKDYIAYLKKQGLEKAERFWKEYLKGFYAPTPLPYTKSVSEKTGAYGKKRIILTDKLSEQIHNFTRDNKITINTLVQAAWGILLSRYSGEDDVLYGVTVSGRSADVEGIEMMVGLFINTIPIRITNTREEKILDWLKRLQIKFAEVIQYEYTPLVNIHQWSDVSGKDELFKSILVLENYPVEESVKQKETKIKISNIKTFEKTNYPLTLVAAPGNIIAFDLAYDADLFDEEMIQQILGHLKNILEFFVTESPAKVKDISFLTNDEIKKLTVDWNATDIKLPENLLIHEQFEFIAEKYKDNIAIVFNNDSYTYGELNRRANKFARYLVKIGIKPESKIGICLDRSFEMVCSTLAVLKCGASFVPLDPAYPKERLKYIVNDSELTVLITDSNLSILFKDEPVTELLIDNKREIIEEQSDENLNVLTPPNNMAYIIYTSGSTGKPKGVMLQHSSLVNFANDAITDFNIDTTARVLQFASFSFDAAIGEIFMALLAGATLVVSERETTMSVEAITDFINKNKISHATLPPSLLSLMDEEKIEGKKTIISVGDSCPWDLALRWSGKHVFFNGYGPTETTVGAIWDVVDKNYLHKSVTTPIGKPIGNVKAYLLDKDMKLVPVGVEGEIYIGGYGVGRGYLNRPELTAEKFIPDPFSDNEGARLYKTGDKGKYLRDGSIEFVGRVDFQVKIRGYRIELGEIEAAINQFEHVKTSVVIAVKDSNGNERLVAYVIPDEEDFNTEDLKEYLRDKLPDFMIPSVIIQMEAFPLSPNGKVDRKALPKPENIELQQTIVLPRTATEELIANIWADVLKLDKVGIYQNFFEIGGHSLLATQVVSRLKESFKFEIPLKTLFDFPTVHLLAAEIEKLELAESGDLPELTKVNRDEKIPLSFSQQRLWFLNELKPNDPSYNITNAFIIKGSLDLSVLKESINEIIKRHEILRTVFVEELGKPYQKILDNLEIEIPVIDLSMLSAQERVDKAKNLAKNEAQKPFNLKKGPLIRLLLIKTAEDEYITIFSLHHIIADGWSIPILIRETVTIYEALKSKEEISLPELQIQYADYAVWQKEFMEGDLYKKELEYWKNELKGIPPVLDLPTDKPRPSIQTFNGAKYKFDLSADLIQELKGLSRAQNLTLFMTMLAVFQTLLHKYSAQKDVVIGTPIAGRTSSQLENLIGFFVNNLVIRTRFENNLTFKELLKQVREVTLGAFTNQDMPFDKLVEELQPVRDLSHTPIFQVMFVFQNIPIENIEISEFALKPFEFASGTTTYDLSLTLNESSEGMSCIFEYNTDLYYESTIERLANYYKHLLQLVVKDIKKKIGNIQLISDTEKEKYLVALNNTEAVYPDKSTVHGIFEKLTKETPSNTALYYAATKNDVPQKLSYEDLNKRANKLAHYLLEKGLKKEDRVAIFLDRSFEMIEAVLGTLKAGGAFMPVDFNYPQERIDYMLEDAKISFIITTSDLEEKIKDKSKVILIDKKEELFTGVNEENPSIDILPDNLAYVIYTSGSTGKPKGTMLAHRGLTNLANVHKKNFNINSESKVLQFSSSSFDASVWETVMALLNGASLFLTSKETVSSGEDLAELIKKNGITTITLPPSVLAIMPKTDMPELKTIITAGEAVWNELVEFWGADRQFFNAYGPTETTVCASMYLCEKEYPKGPPIGKPIDNFKVYVVDENLNPVPVGVPGELLVGGVGLARGYLGKPDLTAEKFIPDFFNEIHGQRLYRTGDLVRLLEDGNIEFLGRIDTQAKVRGFRIELGEIEAQIKNLDQVLDTVVIVREDHPGDKRIVAYVVMKDEQKLDINNFRTLLANVLPDYMIPSAFVQLEKIPLTPNGKVDKYALPVPEISSMDLGVEYVEPRNEIEEGLVEIVKELLNIDKVGVLDNFFALGGHSLLATQFISRVREKFDVEIPLRQLFETPTVEGIAIAVKNSVGKKEDKQPSIKRISREGRKINRSELT